MRWRKWFTMGNRIFFKKTAVEVAMIVVGTAIMALNYYVLMKPNHIMAPGLGGIAIIVAQFVPLSLGMVYFLLNIPLFLIGFRFVGWKFIFYSLCGMFGLSLFLYFFENFHGFHQPLVGAILGGILNGAFLAMILNAKGSTGGLDIAFVVIHKFWPRFTIGTIMFVINAMVVILSGFLFGFGSSVYTILSIFVAGKSLDLCLSRMKLQKVEDTDSSQM